MNTYQIQLLKKDIVAESTMSFIFSKPEGFGYKPGQFAFFRILRSVYQDEKGLQRHFTLSSSPHEPELAFTTRLRNSAFKKTLWEAPPGTEVELEGPLGGFVLPETTLTPLVFLAGGIGITPFFSMLKWINNQSLSFQIKLFYSNRSPQGAAFLEILQKITASNPNIQLIATMTELNNPLSTWAGQTGYIDAEMIKQSCPQWQQAIYYVAGPPTMAQAMIDLTIQLGIPASRVKTEKFDGY